MNTVRRKWPMHRHGGVPAQDDMVTDRASTGPRSMPPQITSFKPLARPPDSFRDRDKAVLFNQTSSMRNEGRLELHPTSRRPLPLTAVLCLGSVALPLAHSRAAPVGTGAAHPAGQESRCRHSQNRGVADARPQSPSRAHAVVPPASPHRQRAPVGCRQPGRTLPAPFAGNLRPPP